MKKISKRIDNFFIKKLGLLGINRPKFIQKKSNGGKIRKRKIGGKLKGRHVWRR